MEPNFTILKTKKGLQKICSNDFTYCKDKTTITSIYWKCTQYKTCKARLNTNLSMSMITRRSGNHNHEKEDVTTLQNDSEFRDLVIKNPLIKPQVIINKFHGQHSKN